MFRYSFPSLKISAGVRIRRIRGPLVSRPATVSTAASTEEAISTVEIAAFIFRKSFAPKKRDMTTEHPMLLPIAMAMKIIVIG